MLGRQAHHVQLIHDHAAQAVQFALLLESPDEGVGLFNGAHDDSHLTVDLADKMVAIVFLHRPAAPGE